MSTLTILAAGAIATLLAGAPQTAQEIAEKALRNNTFSTNNARVEMDLEISKKGKVTRKRSLLTKIKRADEKTRAFVEFRAPADVAGTRFLSVDEGEDSSYQFIYLPAFKKVKRVVGSQRSKSFMGTDFSYSDLDGRDVDSANWRRLEDAKIGGQDCFVIEGVSKGKSEDYGRSVLWVHKKLLVPMRIDFFGQDRKTIQKRFSVRKLEKRDKRWVATDSTMATPKKKTKTRMMVKKISFEANIPDHELTKSALER